MGESGLAERVNGDVVTEFEIVRPQGLRAAAMNEEPAGSTRQLNGPLTALLLYMGEIKQLSRGLSQDPQERAYLQEIVDHALRQTERVCALVKQIDVARQGASGLAGRCDCEERVPRSQQGDRAQLALAAELGRRPLTKREREVLQLISQGYSNKQGALQMCISPRTFESHRAEAMRKLGARKTAELVRAALLLRIGERSE